MSRKACRDCVNFVLRNGSNTSGSCLRSPPVVFGDIGSATFPDVTAVQWCGEWRSKAASGTTGKLYQLPNGQWITAADVSAVLAMDDKHRYCEDADGRFSIRVGVFFKDGCGNHIIPCNAIEAAEAMRDKIAADVNAMVGGAA